MSNIDWDKPVQTRDGREVEIYTTEGRDPENPVIGERLDDSGNWTLFKRPANGMWNSDHEDIYDLVSVPQQHTVWVNVYRDSESGWSAQPHESKDKADRNSTSDRIACFEHTLTEGDGCCDD